MPMNESRIWFGNRRRMQWVKPWAPSPATPRTGYSESQDFINGGTGLETSLDSSGDYTFEWRGNPDALSFVHAYANGRYGRELMYWTEPMFAHRNVLPALWATPWIAADDAIPLIRRARPVATLNADMSLDYPAYGATYSVVAGDESASIMVPIPPGYTAWVGVHGESDADEKIIATPYEGMTAGTPVPLNVLGVDSTTRVNHSFASSSDADTAQSWIELAPDTAATDTFTWIGTIVQILPTGDTPATGGFIEGMGHSGCSIRSISPQPISSAHDRTSVIGRFTEVGSWEAYQ